MSDANSTQPVPRIESTTDSYRPESSSALSPISLSKDQAFERFKIPDSVQSEIHCFGCGYDLQGMDTRSNCPECGAAIWAAFTENVLRMADPAWTARLRLGLRLVMGSVVPMIIAMVIGRGAELIGMEHASITLLGMFVMILMAVTGVMHLTATCPKATERGPSWSAAAVSRIAAVVTFAGVVVGWAFYRQPSGSHFAYGIVSVASPFGLSGWIAVRSLTLHFENLAILAGSSFGAARARLYRKWVDTSWSILTIVFLIGWFTYFGWCVGFFAGASALGITILTFTLPANFVEELDEAARVARESRSVD